MKTEKNDNYLIGQTDLAISELVFDKLSLIKAYNYYSGNRDKDRQKFIRKGSLDLNR